MLRSPSLPGLLCLPSPACLPTHQHHPMPVPAFWLVENVEEPQRHYLVVSGRTLESPASQPPPQDIIPRQEQDRLPQAPSPGFTHTFPFTCPAQTRPQFPPGMPYPTPGGTLGTCPLYTLCLPGPVSPISLPTLFYATIGVDKWWWWWPETRWGKWEKLNQDMPVACPFPTLPDPSSGRPGRAGWTRCLALCVVVVVTSVLPQPSFFAQTARNDRQIRPFPTRKDGATGSDRRWRRREQGRLKKLATAATCKHGMYACVSHCCLCSLSSLISHSLFPLVSMHSSYAYIYIFLIYFLLERPCTRTPPPSHCYAQATSPNWFPTVPLQAPFPIDMPRNRKT